MLHYLGYVGISLSIPASTNRTTRLRNATPERLNQLIDKNLRGLAAVLQFNLDNHVHLFRISSQIIPFASHPVNTLPWWKDYGERLADLGEFIRRHHMRVSMHPAQYTALSALDSTVLDNALLDLEWHARFLDAMHLDSTHKLVLHIGGAYGDKEAAKQRFIDVARDLPRSWRNRLVLENDERIYTVNDVLDVSHATGLPVVFDYLHYIVNPGSEAPPSQLIDACFDTWGDADGLPKTHFSSQSQSGRVGAHADWVTPDEFLTFLAETSDHDFDCMLEAKKKDLALFRLRATLASRGISVEQAA